MKCVSRSRGSAVSQEKKDKVEVSEELKGQTVPRENSATRPACCSAAISRHADGPRKGPHNKENCTAKLCTTEVSSSDNEVTSNSYNLAEDSGYLSLHNSQTEHTDSDLSSDFSSSSLPLLRFQEDVCRALTENYKKCQSYDWTIVNKLAENYGLNNVIGRHMGLEYVDVLCGLFKKNMKHILTRILALLGESDLINCRMVSKTWQKIMCQDKRALWRCQQAERMLRGSVGRPQRSSTRDFGSNRVVLSCLQAVASSTPVHKPTKTQTDSAVATPRPSRFAEFIEAAKSLKSHEALRRCRLCDSPARFDSGMQRAVCMRVSCAFDFCSQCQSAYHGSSPCQRGILRVSTRSRTVLVAGSARSKRTIRRL